MKNLSPSLTADDKIRLSFGANPKEDINLEALELAHLLVDTVLDKKASDIIILDLREQSVLTDYFLLCNGDSNRQINAIADAVQEDAKQKADVIIMNKEGDPNSGWVLLDFGDLIVHVFSPEKRAYYDLEGLWHESHVVLRMQ
ncbi:MAG: ribosome silencing factor [Anaerolineales bacterium]|nr:ribosome silencing factor [Anaerolineales bacterium]